MGSKVRVAVKQVTTMLLAEALEVLEAIPMLEVAQERMEAAKVAREVAKEVAVAGDPAVAATVLQTAMLARKVVPVVVRILVPGQLRRALIQ
jgi:hypothetical protein